MPTNLALDDDLIRAAQELGGHKTKKDAVTATLEEYVQARLRRELLEMLGTVEYDDEFDYRAARAHQHDKAAPRLGGANGDAC